MSTYKRSLLARYHLFLIVFVVGVVFSTAASAVFIGFDTRQDGTPYAGLGESFSENEYDGVVIKDSDPNAGYTYVNLINPANVGTDISGYYVNVGAFASNPQTQLTLDFTTSVIEVSFDFANPTGNLTVSAFDGVGALLGVFGFTGTDLFVNQAGFNQSAGHVDIFGIGVIASLLIEPDSDQALILDNLNFSPVPIPAAVWLFGTGLIGLISAARRKKT